MYDCLPKKAIDIVAHLCPSLDKSKKKKGGFEGTAENDESKSKLQALRRQFPGVCIPDDPERAKSLLQTSSNDVMVAMEAMSEVCHSLSCDNYVTCFLCPLIGRFVQVTACNVKVVIME